MSQEPAVGPKPPEGEQVTILVHGTFANPNGASSRGSGGDESPIEKDSGDGDGRKTVPWWYMCGEEIEPTTAAERLRQELADTHESWARTMGDPTSSGGEYREVGEWSGGNTHRDRLEAAEKLAASLHKMAEARGCDADSPLWVNFVAHSHGGNVVLESLKRLSDSVKARRICMLGTPLTWRFVDLRILYIPFVIWVLYGWIQWVRPAPQWAVTRLQGLFDGLAGRLPVGEALLSGSVAVVSFWMILLPLCLWVAALVIIIARGSSEWPPLGRGEPAYGLRPKDLQEEMNDRPVVLFTSDEDEADLMLQLGAAPVDVYRALVENRPRLRRTRGLRRVGVLAWRFLEFAYVRPLAFVFIVPFVEMVLELKALGFQLRHVLQSNYEMVTWTGSKTSYADGQIERRQVPPRARVLEVTPEPIRPSAKRSSARPGTEPDPERISALRRTLFRTLRGLSKQVHLHHSDYYANDEVIRSIAKVIVGQPREFRQTSDQFVTVGSTASD